jgi:pullulanase/glycogen debranching enzyme
MIALRKNNPLLRRTEFLQTEDVDWHGITPFHPDWSSPSRFVAYTLKDNVKENHLYIAFNARDTRPNVQLPPPPSSKKWFRLVDTTLASPHDFIEDPTQFPPVKANCKMESHSAMILVSLS